MAAPYAAAVQELIDCLGRLPGIGPKSAQRIAFHLLKVDSEEANRLARAIVEVKDKVGFCTRCFNIAEGELCTVCADPRRDAHVLCVVEEPRDVVAIERTREFRGRYHVLQGAIDHLQGIGPEQLRIRELVQRVGDDLAKKHVAALRTAHPQAFGHAAFGLVGGIVGWL